MEYKNQTAFLVQPEKFEIADTPMPEMGADDVLIEVKHVGVCGSDVHFFQDPTGGGRSSKLSIVLGHECAGRVVAAGDNVRTLAPGDMVAIEPGVPCGRCEYCKGGRYNLCRSLTFLAAPPFISGALSRYVAHPADFTYKLADGMSTVDGVMMEPFAIGMYAVKRAGVRAGDTVAILGSGCIGLMILIACKAVGADMVIVADIYGNRLRMAQSMGASATVGEGGEDSAKRILELTSGEGADYIFEAAGNPATCAGATQAVKRGGKIVMVGISHKPIPFDFYGASCKESDIISIFRYVNMYPSARKMIASGKADPAKVVTGIVPFEDVQRAFESAMNEREKTIKTIIEF